MWKHKCIIINSSKSSKQFKTGLNGALNLSNTTVFYMMVILSEKCNGPHINRVDNDSLVIRIEYLEMRKYIFDDIM